MTTDEYHRRGLELVRSYQRLTQIRRHATEELDAIAEKISALEAERRAGSAADGDEPRPPPGKKTIREGSSA